MDGSPSKLGPRLFASKSFQITGQINVLIDATELVQCKWDRQPVETQW